MLIDASYSNFNFYIGARKSTAVGSSPVTGHLTGGKEAQSIHNKSSVLLYRATPSFTLHLKQETFLNLLWCFPSIAEIILYVVD